MNPLTSLVYWGAYRWYLWRARGRIRVGPGLKIAARFQIQGPGRVTIGRGARVEAVPGDKLAVVSVLTHSPDAVVTIGDRARLVGTRIGSKFEVSIGNDVLIEDSAIADTDFHSLDPGRGLVEGENLETCRIVIGDHVAIGARSIVTKGVEIGAYATVLPGSVVVRNVPSGAIVHGNPARPVARPSGPPTGHESTPRLESRSPGIVR